jgi:hypothetical protein
MTPGANISGCNGGLGGKGGKFDDCGGGGGGKTLAAVSCLNPGMSFEVPAASMSFDFGGNPGGGGGGGRTTEGCNEGKTRSASKHFNLRKSV